MSRPLAWILLLSSLAVSAAPPPAQAQAAGVEYQILITCPDAGDTSISTSTQPGGSCPVRAIDGDDLMGDPSLAVDPLRPENLILASRHGQVNGNGPTTKSREGQVFTTFTSQNAGAT